MLIKNEDVSGRFSDSKPLKVKKNNIKKNIKIL